MEEKLSEEEREEAESIKDDEEFLREIEKLEYELG